MSDTLQHQKSRSHSTSQTTVLFMMLLSTCLWSAEIASIDFDPLGILENDLHMETNAEEPNTPTIEESFSSDRIAGTSTNEAAIYNPELNLPAQSSKEKSNVTAINEAPNPTQTMTAVNESGSQLTADDNSISAKLPTTPLQRQLWKDRISVSAQPDISQPQSELEQIIDQINSIEFKSQPQPSGPETDIQPALISEPNGMAANPEAETLLPDKQDMKDTDNKAPEGAVSEETLQRLKDLSQNPDQLNNPFQLAEVLYHSGCLDEAAVCYQTALDRIDDGNHDLVKDKAWILLQLGNCLKSKNPPAAKEKYLSVLNEFSVSPWARVAKAKIDAIDWLLKDQPEKLLSESRKK